MYNDENPWSEWLGDGVFAHPNAPCRGGGFKYRPGIREYRSGAIDPHSPAGRYLNPSQAAQGYAEYELECVLRRLFFCYEPSELSCIAREAFGHDSFSERFSQALASFPPASRFFALQRMMVQAELHDHLQGAGGWQLPFRFSTVVSPKLWEVGHYLRFGSGIRSHEELRKAATTRDALLKELAALFAQPVKVFEEARAKLPAATRENWIRYNDLVKPGGNRTDAGYVLGFVMAKTLTVLADLQRRGDFQAWFTGVAPLLASLSSGSDRAGSSGAFFTEGNKSKSNSPQITSSQKTSRDDSNANSYGKAILIEGDDAFRQKTVASLDQIAATPSGEDLLTSIERSGKTVTIAETSGGNSVSDFSNDAFVKSGGKAGAGSDCTVNYNPNRVSIGPDPWENRPPAIGLAHELVHAEHATHGTIDVAEVQNDHKPDPANPKAYAYTMKEEARTTGIPPHDDGKFSENKIRSEWTPAQPTRPWY